MEKTDLSKTLGILAVSSAMFVGGYSKAETGASGSAPEALSMNTSGATIIKGDFAGQHTFRGDVVIKGDVLPGADIEIIMGGIKVEGNVGAEARITQIDHDRNMAPLYSDNAGLSVSTPFMSLTMPPYGNRWGTETPNADRLSGTKIGGQIEQGASVESTSSITASCADTSAKLDAKRVTAPACPKP